MHVSTSATRGVRAEPEAEMKLKACRSAACLLDCCLWITHPGFLDHPEPPS